MPNARLISRLALLGVTAVGLLGWTTGAHAATRMPVGFQDDATFRWSADAASELDLVQQANASIVRTTVDWYRIAPKRPAAPADSFDPAYNFADLDALVQNAASRGIEVLITIWGTPAWANGGRGPNYAPTRLADLTAFARAVADRYSGRHAGLPYVGRFSVWNEPNLGIFLSPEFAADGSIVGPRIYAGLYRAAYAGIKAGNRAALVAIGETSNQGRDHPLAGAPISVAPGTFARLLARESGLRFDAYAEHPYPTRPNAPPQERVRWPNVTLAMLPRFERSLAQWFHRPVPVWITEYGYQTTPPSPYGVTPARQAAFLASAMQTLRADADVQMFIWFEFRDSATSLWKSGLRTQADAAKPAYSVFARLAAITSGETLNVKAGTRPLISVPVPRLAFDSTLGEPIGVTYRVFDGRTQLAVGQPQEPLLADGSVDFALDFIPKAGKTYTLTVDANNIHGDQTSRTWMLVTPRGTVATTARK